MTSAKLAKIVSAFTDSIATTATYELDGVEQEAEVTTAISGSTARSFVLIPATVSGTVGNIKLLDTDGDLVDTSTQSIVKPAGKKYYVAFLYAFALTEV